MHTEANLLRDFAIIMGVAGLGIVVVRRLGLPSILGYLIAGVLIGPFTFDNPLIEDLETIRRLADIGLVLLLFALGLEFGWERIRHVGPKVFFIGAVDITLMIALGLVFAKSVVSRHRIPKETLSHTMMGPAQVPTTAESTEKG
ncbi:MAG: cation:proton antiporter [Dehalococcoidia bacterium]